MIRKKHIFTLIILLVVGINIYVFSSFFTRTYQNHSVFEAVSKRTSGFIYTQNLSQSAEKLRTFKHLSVLNESELILGLSHQVFKSDSILKIIAQETNLTHQNIVLAANNIGSKQLDFISLVEYAENFPIKKLKAYLKSNKFRTTQYNYQDFPIITINAFMDQKDYTFAVYNNLLLASFNAPLVEEALNTLLKNEGKNIDPNFEVEKLTANQTADWFLFIDHNNAEDLSSVILNQEFTDASAANLNTLDWSCYALTIDSQEINFKTHFTSKNWSKTSFHLLLNSKPAAFSFKDILPNNTAYIEAISSENNVVFHNNDISYSYFKDWLDQEAIFFTLETFDEDFLKRSGLILKANNLDTAKVSLYLLNKEMTPVLNYEGQAIYEMNINVVSKIAQSNIIKLNNPYFAFVGSYVVFANDMNVIRTCIQKFNSKKTLANNKSFNYSIDSLSSKIIYYNPQYFKSAVSAVFKENQFPKQLGSIYTSYTTINNEIVAQGKIGFEQELRNKTQNLWDVVLDTVSFFKPQIVINADNLRKEILIQDVKNTIYLVSQSGDVLLKKPFNEQILSDIYQIDLYKANKLFFVFNTKDHIYALKRDGSIVDGYPIKLPTAATNKLLVVNYDKTKKYRFFIACENEKIYAFEANGKPLEGWSPLGTFGKISTEIKHTTFSGKDYIFFTTDNGTFYAFDRKGDERFQNIILETPFKEAYESTAKGFVGFSNGSAYSIDLNGKTSVKILGDSSYHTFTNYFEKAAYAVANEKEFRLAKSKWTLLGKKTLNDKILNIEKLNIDGKAWFLINASKSVYVFNEMGEIHPDFPMLANSYARVSKFYDTKNELLVFIQGNKLRAFDLYFPK